MKTVKNRVFQPKQLAIKDHQGATLTDPDKIMARWKEHGEKLFDSPSASSSALPPPQEDIVTEPPPLRSGDEYALKKLKSNKSPGLDNIQAELIKAVGPSMINAKYGHRQIGLKTGNNKKWSCYTKPGTRRNAETTK